ncbi:hypothetical protein [Corallococcus aberystwythensis]|uniref:Uncharacterized protein n=1 Tax=Corallococcus aberystwythensis TaxID=2316722 RepID=A0A3A8QVE5_9BACT|nr:hypothetical protein [Corallococcus aberystwythensis]RKH67104.1 hypothetical protein D7W81_14480 [Corallococcus aberystwythensis]
MKDIYVVLDYSAREPDTKDVRTSSLNNYVQLKNEAADRAKWFGGVRAASDIGMVADMRDPKTALNAVLQFIQPKLWSYMTNNIKILVGGHGQVNQSDGIVVGGSEGTKVGMRNRKIAEHILFITRHFSSDRITWHISLCVCFAGRPTKSSTSTISPRSAFRSSMSGELAKRLQSLGLRDFRLKANFTSVSVGNDGHLHADPESTQQERFARANLESTARSRYPRGFQFWKHNSGQFEQLVQFFSYAYANGHYTRDNALDSSAQRAFKKDFLDLVAAEQDPGLSRLVESFQRIGYFDQILNYRLVDIVKQAFDSDSIREANKVIWTCEDGKLSHSLVLRE